MNQFKEEFRTAYKALGLSQGEVAERLGRSQAAVSKWHNPNIELVQEICLTLGLGFSISPEGEVRFEVEKMKYYYLKEGEVIKEGDEVEISNAMKDPAKWVKASEGTLGTRAPNPYFPSHRKYRRPINLNK